MSELSDLEHHAFAYYVAAHAGDLSVAPRFYPHGELILILEDKVKVALRKFGFKAKSQAKPAAIAFLDLMIARGGWSSKENDFGGTMHQFQADTYPKIVAELKETDPVIQKAKAEGEGYWEKAFAELTGQPAA